MQRWMLHLLLPLSINAHTSVPYIHRSPWNRPKARNIARRNSLSTLYNVLERPSSRQKIPSTKLPPDGPTWMIASHTHGEYNGTAVRVSESYSCLTVYCPQIAQSPQTFAWCMKIHIFYIYLHGVSLQRWENLYTRYGGLPLHSILT